MKINGKFPKALLDWMNKHADRVYEADKDFGYICDNARGYAYDILLNRGWCFEGDYGQHTAIEPTAAEMLRMLRATRPCKCRDCETGSGW